MTTALIPSEHLYWGIVEQERTTTAAARLFAWERFLPEPVEGLVVREVRLDRRRWLLVGAATSTIAQRLHEPDAATAWSLVPDRIPDHIRAQVGEIDPARFDLRRGPFEPVRRRRLRQALLAIAWVGGLACPFALTVGLERRAALARSESDSIARQDAVRGQQVLAEPITAGVPLDAALTMATRQIDLLAEAVKEPYPSADQLLGALLALWPSGDLRVGEIRVHEHRITLTLVNPEPTGGAALRATLASIVVAPGRLVLDPAIPSDSTQLTWTWDKSP